MRRDHPLSDGGAQGGAGNSREYTGVHPIAV